MSTLPRDRPLAFMDTETTGLVPGVHEVIEIAITKVCPRTGQKEFYHTLIRPEHVENAEPEALACNSYGTDPTPWDHAPLFREVSQGILEFLKGTVIVGYHVTYDVAMINGVFLQNGSTEKLKHHNLDAMALVFEHLVPLGLTSLKMDAVRDFLGWSKEGAHHAKKDVQDLMDLYSLLNRASWLTRLRIQFLRKLKLPVGR